MLGGTHATALNMERGSESDQKMTLRTVVLLSYWDNVVRNQTGVRAGERSVPLPSHSCDRGSKLSLAGFEKFHAEFQGFDDWPYWISAIDRYTYRSTSLVHGFKMHTCSCDCWCILEWSAPNTIYTRSVTHFHTSHMFTFTHKHTQHIHRHTDTHTHTLRAQKMQDLPIQQWPSNLRKLLRNTSKCHKTCRNREYTSNDCHRTGVLL